MYKLFFKNFQINYMESKTSILVIYTGGTIGMIKDPETGALHPINMDLL